MADRGAGRDAVVVGLGGGVTTDLAGFVAATWMRGIAHVLVPTSLLAMVDAAVGGKSGVDVPWGKNLVGAFHQPVAVVVDPETLSTLPDRELDCGLAEMVKHALIADSNHLQELLSAAEELREGDAAAWGPLITRSIRIKAEIVHRDEFEVGERAVLNTGHTIGHAIEAAARYGISHGHAVSVGLAAEARIAARLGLLSDEDVQRVEEALSTLGLPQTVPEGLEPTSILAATRLDKKGRAGQVRYSLLAGIGRPSKQGVEWTREVPDDVVIAVLEELLP
jgi:3-dehydroquinate synthase